MQHAWKRSVYRVLLGKPYGKSPLESHRHSWKDNIKIALTETEGEGMNWIHLAQDRDQWKAPVTTVMNLRIP
jgi:hypothetical protein